MLLFCFNWQSSPSSLAGLWLKVRNLLVHLGYLLLLRLYELVHCAHMLVHRAHVFVLELRLSNQLNNLSHGIESQWSFDTQSLLVIFCPMVV